MSRFLLCALILLASFCARAEDGAPKAIAARTPQELANIKAEIRKRLSRKVSFDFNDVPFDEALQFLNSLSKVGIVIDPAASESAKKTVTLKCTDIPMDVALSWLGMLTDLRCEIRDKLFVRVRTQADNVELQIYDIRGLVRTKDDLGYDWLLVIGKEAMEAAQKEYAAREKEEIEFANSIKAIVPSEAWDDLLTMYEQSSGKLIVMQTTVVHAQIAAHLAKLKAAHVNK